MTKTITVTDPSKTITVSSSGKTISVSDATKTIGVDRTAASVVTLPVVDTTALVKDPADNTKLARIDAGAISAGTTRTIIMGDRDVDLAVGGTFSELAGSTSLVTVGTITTGTWQASVIAHEYGGLEADVSAGDGFVEIKGGSTTVIKSNLAASVAPGVSDDSAAGYAVGSQWIDTTGGQSYVCVDASVGAAVWSSGGGFTVDNEGLNRVITSKGVGLGGNAEANMTFDGQTLEFFNTGKSVFIGEMAGAADDLSDNENVFVGRRAGQATSTATFCVAIGSEALELANANFNVAIGKSALKSTTSGDSNFGLGYQAGFFNQTGRENCFLGTDAGRGTTFGNFFNNTAIGYRCLRLLTNNAARNTAIGYLVGDNITSGQENILIGQNIDAQSATGSDQITIGNLITGNATSTGTTAATGSVGIGTFTFPTGTTNAVLVMPVNAGSPTAGAGTANAWVDDVSAVASWHFNDESGNVYILSIQSTYTQTYATATTTHAALTSATLTDSTGGTANTTVVAVPAVNGSGATTAQEGAINDNFADLTAQVNALRVDLENAKQVINQLIDDLQVVGLVG